MEKELKIEAVKLSPKEQYLIRKNIVRLLEQKKTNSEIAEILGVSERHVRSVKKTYSEKGIEGLKPQKRGREKGNSEINYRYNARPDGIGRMYVDAKSDTKSDS